MVNFFETGIDTEYLTIFIVTLALIIGIVLPLSIYHLQKPRPKIKIDRFHSRETNNGFLTVTVYVKNIGYLIAEELKYEMTSLTKGVVVNQKSIQSMDLLPNGSWAPAAAVSIKQGEKCKIKIELSWDNHTLLLKKRNKLTQEFTCDRTGYGTPEFKKC